MSISLTILTPSSRMDKRVDHLRAEDSSGSFGILTGHTGLLTTLKPSVLIYRQGGSEAYIAVDGGVLRVEGGAVTVASPTACEGPDLAKLRELVECEFCIKEEREAAFEDLLGNMEKLLMDNIVKLEKG